MVRLDRHGIGNWSCGNLIYASHGSVDLIAHSWAGCRGDFIDAAAAELYPVMDDTTVAGRV